MTFAEAFPTVKSATIDVTEQSYSQEWPTHMTEKAPRPLVDCSNSVCYGGGVGIQPILSAMVREGATDSETRKPCKGYEGSRREKVRDCLHSFTVRVHLDYEDAPA
ncbi:MAG TPA: hypothetical protein VMW80_00015 [Candidatus Dormibacteraeota bacterium]|nr:hypothetical protein [Candidatus Dormibacteraeota bacterium]